MDILQPNNGQKVQYIISDNIYVKIWDYGKPSLLTHLKIPNVNLPMSESVWVWIRLKPGEMTDLSNSLLCSFDDSINKAVNNPYCTVYSFTSYEEMAENWNQIKYIDTITTTFRSKIDE